MGCKGFLPSSVIPAEARHMSRARQMLEALLIMIIQTIIPAKKDTRKIKYVSAFSVRGEVGETQKNQVTNKRFVITKRGSAHQTLRENDVSKRKRELA